MSATPRHTIVLATSNPGKMREVRALLADLPVRLPSAADFPDVPVPDESADSFEGNAVSKALHYATHCWAWALADDSGLEVDALGGQPGVHSARFAGPAGDARANNAKLIAALAGVEPERRTARFRCVMALAGDGGILAVTTGALEGVITSEPRGEEGFGYDPYFLVPQAGRTTAEMSVEEKNRISHRGAALRAMRRRIEELLRRASSDESMWRCGEKAPP